jgi:hypothetical protein
VAGKIRFGYGLGDLSYLIFIAVLTLIQISGSFLIKYKVKPDNKYIWYFILGTIFFSSAIKLTWDFTYGRGSESAWNGNIFF